MQANTTTADDSRYNADRQLPARATAPDARRNRSLWKRPDSQRRTSSADTRGLSKANSPMRISARIFSALASPLRIFSAFKTENGVKIWVISEADRSATTILLPSEY